jgi:hypothetical protein
VSVALCLQELAKVFKTDVNGLPLSLDISWFEQKAVAVLLTLLHLGVKNIRWAGKQSVCCMVLVLSEPRDDEQCLRLLSLVAYVYWTLPTVTSWACGWPPSDTV